MHAALYFVGLWALAFITLCAALVLLNIFDAIIGNDLMLNSAGKEAVMAGVASLIEGGSLWLVITFVPTAARALVIPALIVALVYKLGHLEDWSRYDVVMLLLFQGVLISVVMCLFAGLFLAALVILMVLAVALIVLHALTQGVYATRWLRLAAPTLTRRTANTRARLHHLTSRTRARPGGRRRADGW